MNEKACFIIGLPDAGKTTYLAALAYALQQGKTKTKLRLEKFSGNQQYLSQLVSVWLEATEVSRTSKQVEQTALSINLLDDEDTQYKVKFPDLSGETFQRQYLDREMDADIATSIRGSDSIILFVNPNDVYEPVFISSIDPKLRDCGINTEMNTRNPVSDDPTVVQLIELLNFVSFIKDQNQIKLTIIISAWDLVCGEYKLPEAFVKERLSLLWQYLNSNSEMFCCDYFGVSAQGGDLKNEDVSEALLIKYQSNPAERARVVDNCGNECHDISLPLWTAMNRR